MKTSIIKNLIYSLLLINAISCTSKKAESKLEEIHLSSREETPNPDTINSIQGNALKEISTVPHSIVLTGMADHRLVTVYKQKNGVPASSEIDNFYSYENSRDDEEIQDQNYHFMPGLDLLNGFNLYNIAHYDLKNEKLNFMFEHPVLIKSLYYPSFLQDSLYKKPINRNYYLVSAYDEDTNKDTLINKKDLRRFYYFDASCTVKTQVIPADYSVIRSQYDPKNDAMYIYARHDSNKNGTEDKKEPIHIFLVYLNEPSKSKLLY